MGQAANTSETKLTEGPPWGDREKDLLDWTEQKMKGRSKRQWTRKGLQIRGRLSHDSSDK